MTTKHQSDVPSGIGVDSSGEPVVDPTANVLLLVEAAVRRLDDLRVSESRRIEELLSLETSRTKEVAKLHAMYQEKLSMAEAKRIDAIRAVDVAAVGIASDRVSQQAAVLANQAVASAETLRALVATTATTVASQLATMSGQLAERISALEKSSYVGSGKQAMADPMLAELVTEMKKLQMIKDMGTGKSVGYNALWGYIVGAVGLVTAIVSVILSLK
jgi:hypothetical protein